MPKRSKATSTDTQSHNPYPDAQLDTNAQADTNGEDAQSSQTPARLDAQLYDEMELDTGSMPADGPGDLALTFPPDNLPHIPLRPFRNQVGGHSAIYKFTRRAVCKVG